MIVDINFVVVGFSFVYLFFVFGGKSISQPFAPSFIKSPWKKTKKKEVIFKVLFYLIYLMFMEIV